MTVAVAPPTPCNLTACPALCGSLSAAYSLHLRADYQGLITVFYYASPFLLLLFLFYAFCIIAAAFTSFYLVLLFLSHIGIITPKTTPSESFNDLLVCVKENRNHSKESRLWATQKNPSQCRIEGCRLSDKSLQ